MSVKDFLTLTAAFGTAIGTVLGIIGSVYSLFVDVVGTLPAVVLGVFAVVLFVSIVLSLYNTRKLNQARGDD